MNDLGFEIHDDITQAYTLPSCVYTDPRVYESIKEQIFVRSWQFVGDSGLVKVPGQVYPFLLLEGCLDEPLLLTRDTEDRIHCVSNVCTHRGNLVCEGAGNERFLRCRYHGRRFGLDGAFQHMPEFEDVQGFPSGSDHLPKIPFAKWSQFLFACLKPELSFENWLAPMASRVGWLPLDEFLFDPSQSRDYRVRANWALYVDNYLEGFHIPFIHAGLNDVLTYDDYRTELFDHGNLQVGIAKKGEVCFDLPKSSPDYGQKIAAYYFWLFPNIMFNFYPWGLSINIINPLSFNLTKVSFFRYVWDTSKLGKGAGADLDRVEREDEAVVESTMFGVRSRLYDRGRYSPKREVGTHHFHKLLLKLTRFSSV